MSDSENADLNKLKARAAELLPHDAPTTLYELVNLRQRASDILLGWGSTYKDIRLEIEALDFEPYVSAYDKNRPVTPDTLPFVGKGRDLKQLGSYLSSQMERYIRLIEAAQRLRKSEPFALPVVAHQTGPQGENAAVVGLDGLPAKKQDLSEYMLGARLTERQRDCLSLRLEYGLTTREIAARLGLRHHSTVEQHIQAASVKIQRLRSLQESERRRTKQQA